MAKTKERRKERERGEKARKKNKKNKNKKLKKKRVIEVKKVAEKWKIWNEEVKAAKSEEEAKKLFPQRFHKWIHIFGKNMSERMPMKKLWDHVIEVKEEFVLRKGKVY